MDEVCLFRRFTPFLSLPPTQHLLQVYSLSLSHPALQAQQRLQGWFRERQGCFLLTHPHAPHKNVLWQKRAATKLEELRW